MAGALNCYEVEQKVNQLEISPSKSEAPNKGHGMSGGDAPGAKGFERGPRGNSTSGGKKKKKGGMKY